MAEVPCTDLESLVEQLYDALAPLLETPFALFGGEDDPETGSEDLDAWQQLYGFICVNGLKILINNQVDFNNTKNIVIAATM